MQSPYEAVIAKLQALPRTWLITGVAGFIGSHLLQKLLTLQQRVIGLDNFSTGYRENIERVRASLTPRQWSNFRLIEGDIRQLDDCRQACQGVDYVLHEAALGSVPRSVNDPLLTHENNISGFLKLLVAARDAGVRNFVYAASSSTYGDDQGLPKREDCIGQPLSPYAVTKYADELYASVFFRCYGMNSIGLRYFNVFGPRQDPNGAYAAVIPRWIDSLLSGKTIYINGDGETSRDFCYVDNAVQANLLAAVCEAPEGLNQVYNVAVNRRTSLNQLFTQIRTMLAEDRPHIGTVEPVYCEARAGDVRHSQADIEKAKRLLGYAPTHTVVEGLRNTLTWYARATAVGA